MKKAIIGVLVAVSIIPEATLFGGLIFIAPTATASAMKLQPSAIDKVLTQAGLSSHYWGKEGFANDGEDPGTRLTVISAYDAPHLESGDICVAEGKIWRLITDLKSEKISLSNTTLTKRIYFSKRDAAANCTSTPFESYIFIDTRISSQLAVSVLRDLEETAACVKANSQDCSKKWRKVIPNNGLSYPEFSMLTELKVRSVELNDDRTIEVSYEPSKSMKDTLDCRIEIDPSGNRSIHVFLGPIEQGELE